VIHLSFCPVLAIERSSSSSSGDQRSRYNGS
jgi:hypothetical protein